MSQAQSETPLAGNRCPGQAAEERVRLDRRPDNQVGGGFKDADSGFVTDWLDGESELRVFGSEAKVDAPLQRTVNDQVEFPTSRRFRQLVTLDPPPGGHPPPIRTPEGLVGNLGFLAVINSIRAPQFHLDGMHA